MLVKFVYVKQICVNQGLGVPLLKNLRQKPKIFNHLNLSIQTHSTCVQFDLAISEDAR